MEGGSDSSEMSVNLHRLTSGGYTSFFQAFSAGLIAKFRSTVTRESEEKKKGGVGHVPGRGADAASSVKTSRKDFAEAAWNWFKQAVFGTGSQIIYLG